LNKPKDYITTVSDEFGRKTVMDLIAPVFKIRLCPVGRLDKDTTGLLLLTNDGELAQKLAHPRNNIKKVYIVTLDRPFNAESLQLIRNGVCLRDGPVKVDAIVHLPDRQRATVKVTLHSGKYRVVRRLFEHVGYRVKKLDRVQYADLTKHGLPVGYCRVLKRQEVKALKDPQGRSNALVTKKTSPAKKPAKNIAKKSE
jgi:23S rRNA pseudouridine2605 synthase